MDIQYKIKLNSISKCRKYCECMEAFRFSGYIKAGNIFIDKDDIQSIVENCLCKDAELVITIILEEDKEPVRQFLEDAELISR